MRSRNILAYITTVAITAGLAAPAAAGKPIHSAGRMGLGLGAGTIANGLSFKYFMTDGMALQLNAGTFGGGGLDGRYKDQGGVAVSADVLMERGPLVDSDVFSLDWCWGLGGGIGTRNDATGIAAAFVAGLELDFKVIPIDLAVEYRPTLALQPDVDFEPVDFTGHLRFYFQ